MGSFSFAGGAHYEGGVNVFSAEELLAKCGGRLAEKAGAPLTAGAVQAHLDAMANDPVCPGACSSGGKYFIHSNALAHAVKQILLEDVVRQKVCHRIRARSKPYHLNETAG